MKNFSFRRLWLLVLLLAAAGRAGAQAPTWQWAESLGIGTGRSTNVDAAGNVYLAGYFNGTTTFGATTLTSAGGRDAFIAKRNRLGAWQWAARVGGTTDDFAYKVALDNSGNVYLAGKFSSPTINFDTITLINAGADDAFIAKLDSAGIWQWGIGVGGSGREICIGLAIDSTGAVYTSGSFESTSISLGSTVLSVSGSTDGFVGKLNSAGRWLWAVGVSGADTDVGYSVAMAHSGSVYVTGFFSSTTLTLGGTTLTNAGAGDGFTAKLSPNGTWQWAVSIGGTDQDFGGYVAVDSTDAVYISGRFSSRLLSIGGTTLLNSGPTGFDDAYIAKLNSAGLWQWATRAGGLGNDYGQGLTLDKAGALYVSGGFFSSTIQFGTTTLTRAGNYGTSDGFVAKLNSLGDWQWAISIGGQGSDNCLELISSADKLYVTGSFKSGVIDFGSTTLTHTGMSYDENIYIAQLGIGPNGLPTQSSALPLTLAPNPAHHTATLSGATAPTATLIDGLGRVVRTWPLAPGPSTLDLRGLPAGLYVVRAGGATRRLVVE